MAEGRRADAVDYAVEHLRLGESHALFLNAVADLLEPKPVGKKGRPKPQIPSWWYEIGHDYDVLRSHGLSAERALEDLAKKYSVGGEKTIARRVRFYENVMAEVRAEQDRETDN
jgi:hypothetical protein